MNKAESFYYWLFRNRSQSQKAWLSVVAALTLYIVLIVHTFPDNANPGLETQSFGMLRTNDTSSAPRQVITKDFGGGKATLQLEMLTDGNNTFVTGQQYASVAVNAKNCLSPSFSIRLVGEALISVSFVEASGHKQVLWLGEFTIPYHGTYSVDARWFGCTPEETNDPLHANLTELTEFEVTGSHVDRNPDHGNIFADSSWLSKRLFPSISKDKRFADYVWSDLQSAQGVDDEYIHLDNKNVSIARHGTFTDRGMYKFSELGNYEIVCFWGGATLHRIRELFLHEKKLIANGQRPFKFHFYNVTRFQNPDRDWDQSDKERCRKCKHIFLSIDDIELLSQTDFEEQFQTFILHLQRLMDDSTFPLWVLSESGTSQMNRADNCHEPLKYPRSSDHPCNEVLKALFQRQPSPFQKRVHFLDNTALVSPTLHSDITKDTLLANIAMRIFVAVGKGVSDWRSVHQAGQSDGLHRNGTIEPNFKLIPYDWSSPLSV